MRNPNNIADAFRVNDSQFEQRYAPGLGKGFEGWLSTHLKSTWANLQHGLENVSPFL
jgi:hypothetical protein